MTQTFEDALARLERRALQIQLDHFKIPPQERGRAFYAMEVVGEMGELVNDCKKFVRTRLAHRRSEQAQAKIPGEAADTLIALMLVKLAAGDERRAAPPIPRRVMRDNLGWLHARLSRLALAAGRLYAAEARSWDGPAGAAAFSLPLYTRIVGELLRVAACFEFDLANATDDKLTRIIDKVAAGHYD
ncbi:hypothetical protein GX586_09435 [bacterium]|nr:hypothetical protein [bacterium]